MKIKTNKMPTTLILLAFSWLILIFALFAAAKSILIKSDSLDSLIAGILIVLSGVLGAVLVRMFANIGQLIQENLSALKNIHDSLSQINCDSKDINQNIHKISLLFGHIEEQLDLKK